MMNETAFSCGSGYALPAGRTADRPPAPPSSAPENLIIGQVPIAAKEAAALLGTSPTQARRMMQNGQLVATKVGVEWRTSKAAVEAYLLARGNWR